MTHLEHQPRHCCSRRTRWHIIYIRIYCKIEIHIVTSIVFIPGKENGVGWRPYRQSVAQLSVGLVSVKIVWHFGQHKRVVCVRQDIDFVCWHPGAQHVFVNIGGDSVGLGNFFGFVYFAVATLNNHQVKAVVYGDQVVQSVFWIFVVDVDKTENNVHHIQQPCMRYTHQVVQDGAGRTG